MKYEIKLSLISDDGREIVTNEVIKFEKSCERIEHIGLSLKESKLVLGSLQTKLVQSQIREILLKTNNCSRCNKTRTLKGHRTINYRTLFGDIELKTPRYRCCQCEVDTKRSFSPLSEFFQDYVSPELSYMEAKWSSLLSYGVTLDLLKDCFPINEKSSIETVRQHTYKVANKLEAELGEERHVYALSLPMFFNKKAYDNEEAILGIDGGYVRSWEDKKKNFEVIVGKSIPKKGGEKSFGFVQTHDKKSKRRLFEVLTSQGITHEQGVCFMADGEDGLRRLQRNLNPNAKHVLDWFHITMRITVLNQYIKGLILIDEPKGNEIQKSLESIKWKLWHGKPIDALAKIEKLSWKVTAFEKTYSNYIKLIKQISEFFSYISRNMAMIIDYGKRWREGRRISSAFIESLVNSLLNKRFCKKQQMQWKKQNAHLLLQVRVKVINDELAGAFKKWYPDFSVEANDNKVSAIQYPSLKPIEMPSANVTQVNSCKKIDGSVQLKEAA